MRFRTLLSASVVHPNLKSDSPAKLSGAEGAQSIRPFHVAVYLIPAIIGCALDLWTKQTVFHAYGMPARGNRHWIWQNLLGIETALNEGALFGMGQGMVPMFVGLSAVALVGIVYWLFVAKAARHLPLTFALGMMSGGIVGNLYDRLGLWGGATHDGKAIYAVRDWILIGYGGFNVPYFGYTWPNFNIADSLMVVGAGLIVWHAFFLPENPSAST